MVPTWSTISNSHFNSIKVQLELSNQKAYHSIQLFQFHKGTIRTVLQILQHTYEQQFQFHKGTIRTIYIRKMHIIISVFQFHKGTIRTLVVHFYVLLVCDFNSIKVQLELWL